MNRRWLPLALLSVGMTVLSLGCAQRAEENCHMQLALFHADKELWARNWGVYEGMEVDPELLRFFESAFECRRGELVVGPVGYLPYCTVHGQPTDFWMRNIFQAGLNAPNQADRHWHYNLLMAQLLANPESTEYDIAEAFRFVSRAAESGDFVSLYLVGWHYSEGAGVRRDDARAVSFFQKSAELGYPPAQYMVGLAYQRGFGIAPDLEAAAHWHRLAAEAGHELAQERLREIEEQLPSGEES